MDGGRDLVSQLARILCPQPPGGADSSRHHRSHGRGDPNPIAQPNTWVGDKVGPALLQLAVLLGVGWVVLALLFAYAMSWAGAAAGLWLHNPESAQATGFVVLFPLAFISNAFVATQSLPPWLGAVADRNPISTVTASCRSLFGNPNPSALIQVWPLQHPELATALWALALLVVFIPLAIHPYRRESQD